MNLVGKGGISRLRHVDCWWPGMTNGTAVRWDLPQLSSKALQPFFDPSRKTQSDDMTVSTSSTANRLGCTAFGVQNNGCDQHPGCADQCCASVRDPGLRGLTA